MSKNTKLKVPGRGHEKDTVTKAFFSNPQNFAELLNKTLFVRSPIDWRDLRQVDPVESAVVDLGKLKELFQLLHDLMMDYEDDHYTYAIGFEGQSNRHYTMPLKEMGYNYLRYVMQVSMLEMMRSNSGEKLTGEEYLSRFKKSDKLKPIVNIVLYYGEEPWDGPEKLSDMLLPIAPNIAPYVQDYKINVIDVRRLSDDKIDSFDGEVKAVLGFIRNSGDMNRLEAFVQSNRALFENMSIVASKMISVITNTKVLEEYADTETEGEVNMCKALEDMVSRGEARGKAEGIVAMCRSLKMSVDEIVEKLVDMLGMPQAQARETALMYA